MASDIRFGADGDASARRPRRSRSAAGRRVAVALTERGERRATIFQRHAYPVGPLGVEDASVLAATFDQRLDNVILRVLGEGEDLVEQLFRGLVLCS